MQELIFCFAVFFPKKRHFHIKQQKVKRPDNDNIIHYETPLQFDRWGYTGWGSNPRPQTCYPHALPTRATVLCNLAFLCVLVPLYACIYSIFCIFCIFCILLINIVLIPNGKGTAIIVYCNYCLVPHPRAQLFTNHHLQPSPLFSDLSQKAPGKSADSRRMA